MDRPEQVKTADEDGSKRDLRKNLNITDRYEHYQQSFTEFFTEFKAMWDDFLGLANVAKQYVEWKLLVNVQLLQPHTVQHPEQRTLKTSIRTNAGRESDPAYPNGLRGLILFDPNKYGLLRFLVDYQKFNAVTVRDAYPSARMDVYIGCKGDESDFIAFDANNVY